MAGCRVAAGVITSVLPYRTLQSMKKYIVNYSRKEYGYVRVEAENESEAEEKAQELINHGKGIPRDGDTYLDVEEES